MTVPINSSASSDSDDAIEDAIDWVRLNAKAIGIGLAVVAAAAIGWYFYKDGEASKENAASKAYLEAQRSMSAGNLPLAQSDLEKMLPRYHGTQSGTLAAILLAQVQYSGGKFADGVKVLDQALVSAPSSLRPALKAMVGNGLMDQKKYVEAAKAYAEAAAMVAAGNEKEGYQAEGARALQLANNPAEAIKLWKLIVENPESSRQAEARVRLGELEAAPAK